jgi:hypothetical protein
VASPLIVTVGPARPARRNGLAVTNASMRKVSPGGLDQSIQTVVDGIVADQAALVQAGQLDANQTAEAGLAKG